MQDLMDRIASTIKQYDSKINAQSLLENDLKVTIKRKRGRREDYDAEREERLVIVELEPGVYLAEGEGDPPRTTKRQNARRYQSGSEAAGALLQSRKYRPFENSRLIFLCEPNDEYLSCHAGRIT